MKITTNAARVSVLALAFSAAVPLTFAAVPDDAVRLQIVERLRRAGLDREADVRVDVRNGEARLTGVAVTVHALREVERQARKVTEPVDNRLRVVPVEPHTDSEIAAAVTEAILRYPYYTVFDSVEGRVENGVVSLRGSVLQPYRRTAIENRIEKIPGVRGIANAVAVQPVSIHDSRLRRGLVRAIYDDPRFVQYASWANPPVRIVVDRGRVTLSGLVATRVEQVVLGHIARGFPLFGFENKVRVEGERSEDTAQEMAF
jgi:osmotically-inducible protein OsmY